ncbi:MAG: hypothetical protein ACRDL5_00370 [Solirubrobacteraceae bacterium]
MRRLDTAARGVWEFAVGDDWRIALGVAVALGVTAIAADYTDSVWWILPLATVVLLAASVWGAARPPR